MLALAGCGGGSAVDRSPESEPCETRVPARNPSDTLTVVLFDTVDLSHAPWGHNREERFIFSHLYETLLAIDCHGAIQPALAKSILEASDGWLITLRDDAQFWDEMPVTAQDVVESFKPAITQGIAIKSVDPVDEHTLLIRGYSGRPDLKLLTLQMLSIAKPSPTAGPPIGTGSWTLDESVPFAEAVVIRPVLAEVPVVRFVQGNVSDARDIMDGTADAMITDDPTAIEYARAKKTGLLAPLAWDRAYVLLSRSRATQIDQGQTVANVPRSVSDALARDAVTIDARGGSSIAVDAENASRGREIGDFVKVPIFSEDRAILVAWNDPVSRSLAERIVALASMDTSSSADARAIVRAVPGAGPRMHVVVAAPAEFEFARRAGNAFAFVVALSWCSDFPGFIGNGAWAPWLYTNFSNQERFIPLVETRAHFVAISDRIGFVDDHTGDVRIMIPGEEKRR